LIISKNVKVTPKITQDSEWIFLLESPATNSPERLRPNPVTNQTSKKRKKLDRLSEFSPIFPQIFPSDFPQAKSSESAARKGSLLLEYNSNFVPGLSAPASPPL
jgi:hypothetical protein